MLRMHCPSDNQLAELVQGCLSEPVEQETYLHIESCEACHVFLAEFVRCTVVTNGEEPVTPPDAGLALGSLLPGDRVGRYTIGELLGQGGAGEVHSAHDSDLDRTVALKFLNYRESVPSEQSRNRLAQEARSLARLSHPNVVTVYEFGEHEGREYIAMEYVEGVTLDVWVGQRAHSQSEILAVLLSAGRGLAAAHKVGLVHRDFKPSNILVRDDGTAQVTDFGLAHREDAEGLAEDARELAAVPVDRLTQTGSIVGTPAYMAPEQFLGAPTDARTDQFGFCVTLYETLCGERPFEGAVYKDLADNVLRGHIRQSDAESKLSPWIVEVVLRGLSTDRALRFASMDELLSALVRDPRKKRRRRIKALAMGIAVALLASLSMFALTRDNRALDVCGGAKKKLAGVWDDETMQAVKISLLASGRPHAPSTFRRVAEVLSDRADTWAVMHKETCLAITEPEGQVDPAMHLRMACLEQRVQDMRALTELLAQGADVDVADHAVEVTLKLDEIDDCTRGVHTVVPLPKDPALRGIANDLRQRLAKAMVLNRAAKFEDGLAIATSVVFEARKIQDQALLAEALFHLGTLQGSSGQWALAETSMRASVALATEANHDVLAAKIWLSLINIVGVELGKRDEVPALQRAAELAVARAGNPDSLIAALNKQNGLVSLTQGQLDEAHASLDQSLSIFERLRGPAHPEVDEVMNILGIVLFQQGRYAEAKVIFERSLASTKKLLGPLHPDVLSPLANLTSVSHALADYEQGLLYGQAALELSENALGPNHPGVAVALSNLGTVQDAQGHYVDAQQSYQRALQIQENSGSDVVSTLINLGIAFANQGKFTEAQASLERALAGAEQRFGPNHPMVATVLETLAGVLYDRREFKQALPYVARSLAIAESNSNLIDVAMTLNTMAAVLNAHGKVKEATAAIRRALKITEKELGPKHPTSTSYLVNLATLERQRGEFAIAIGLYQRGLDNWKERLGPHHPKVAEALTNIGECQLALHKWEAARQTLEGALRIRSQEDVDEALVADTRLSLAKALWYSKTDRVRSRELAVDARDAYADAGERRATSLAAAETWLRKHPYP